MLIKVCDEAAATYEYIPTTSFSKNAECFLKYVASLLQISALKYAFDELLAKHARAVNDRQSPTVGRGIDFQKKTVESLCISEEASYIPASAP